ncbi:MAG: hypothetical protein M0P39_10080 [Rhodocyclaceae bacterium]|jgi:hypothetical protein|nr:hypothetical protein [Rhodocyclaceae bacterium]
MFRLIVSCSLLLLLAACSSLLPEGKQVTRTRWDSFQDAKAVFDRIEPYRTPLKELHALGFDPAATPNLQVLNYSQVVKRVLPTTTLALEEHPKAVRDCFAAEERCFGYALEQNHIERHRVGNFFVDFLNFSREVEITGWRFSVLVAVVDGVVVFKQWNGQPVVHEVERSHNPLGPLQGSGEGSIR